MNSESSLSANVPYTMAGARLDQVLAQLFPDYSRSRLQQWVRSGQVEVDGRMPAVRDKMHGGEHIRLRAEVTTEVTLKPESMALDCVYRDESILVINKPAGLVVHPAAGHADGTLQNALLFMDPALASVPRCGIVHRLDKDTTGLMVVARNLKAHHSLVAQLQARSVKREYLALVHGALTAGGTIDEPIGRHPVDRKRFAVRPDGREAITHFRIETRLAVHTLLRVRLETGRTHQIRVHFSHRHHPLVGDPVYGGRARLAPGLDEPGTAFLRDFRRQALHAERLGLVHPQSGEHCLWERPIPQDFRDLLAVLGASHD